jgi:hypothetical protein
MLDIVPVRYRVSTIVTLPEDRLMKLVIAKVWQAIFGYDHRRWFPEKWDLSEVYVWKEYGGNANFIKYYKNPATSVRFCNGIDIRFYGNSFKVKAIVGYTYSGICSIAVNKTNLGCDRYEEEID